MFAAFWPALGADFVNWDDHDAIVGNAALHGLSLEHLRWMFTTTFTGPYQPLSWLTLAIDGSLWGFDDPHAFHRTNVVLHALTALAVFQLAHGLLRLALPAIRHGSPDVAWASVVTALLFAVHPLRCESVAWITERRDVLSGLFYVSTVIAYLRAHGAEGSARFRWLLLSLALFLLALLSKASGVTLPLVLLVLDAWPLGRMSSPGPERRRAVLEKLPFLALSCVFGWIAIRGQAGEVGAMRGLADHGVLQRLVQASYATCFYVWKSLWPTALSPIYEMPRPLVPSDVVFVSSAVAAVTITAIAIALRERLPAVACAWVAYIVLLAPLSGLLQAGPQLVADRYSYLACIPFALLAAGGLLAWIERRPDRRTYALQFACGVVLLLGALTFRQAQVWRSSESLWSHALRQAPDSPTALQNFGMDRLQAAESARDVTRRRRFLEQARISFERGVDTTPNADFCSNLGLTFVRLAESEPARAREFLGRAREQIERGIEIARARGLVDPELERHRADILERLDRADASGEDVAQ